MAETVGWRSKGNFAHNNAVILAARNAGFIERKLLVPRQENVTGAGIVEVFVFTKDGVAAFNKEIDASYPSGKSFCIEPISASMKNRCFVFKA